MPKELTVSEWFIEIEKGLNYRRKYGIEDSWGMLEALYLNVHESQANSAPNLISSTGDTIISALKQRYPYISAEALRPDALQASPVVESVDNQLNHTMGVGNEMERAYLSAYLWGVGFLKNGYDSEFGYDPRFDLGVINKQPIGLTMTQFDMSKSGGNRIEFGNIEPGMPWVQACMPHDIVVPWGTWSVDTSEWIVHRVIRHVDDCKADKKYKGTSSLQPTMSAEDFMKTYQSPFKPSRLGRMGTFGNGRWSTTKAEYVELWEIHDKRSQKIRVIATGFDKFLRDETDMLQLDGKLPFTQIKWTTNCRSLWVTPDAYYLLPHQLELTDITLQNSKLRRTRVLKGIIDEAMFEEEELQRLTSARIAALVKCKGNPQQAISWTSPPPDYSLQNEANLVRQSAEQTIGLGDNQRGQYVGGRRTATEANQVAEASGTRLGKREGNVETAYSSLFEKINDTIFRFWKTPRLTQILDQQGIATWVQFTGDGIKSEYKLSVCLEQTGPYGRNERRQMAMQLYPMLQADPTVDQMKLRQWFTRSMNDLGLSSVYKDGILNGQTNANLLVQMQQQQMSRKGGAGGQNGSAPAQNGPMPQMQGAGY